MRETLIKSYSEDIRGHLKNYGMDIQVSDTIEERDIGDLTQSLWYGVSGIIEAPLAMMISGDGAKYKGTPVQIAIVPPTVEGSFLVDENNTAIGADLFYVYEEGEVKVIQPSEPLPLDAVNAFYRNSDRKHWDGPKEMLVNSRELLELTDSKLSIKEVLQGIPKCTCLIVNFKS